MGVGKELPSEKAGEHRRNLPSEESGGCRLELPSEEAGECRRELQSDESASAVGELLFGARGRSAPKAVPCGEVAEVGVQ